MEKYARQALSEGVKSDSELHVTEDSELYRVINVHYNRNNHIEVNKYIQYHIIRLRRSLYALYISQISNLPTSPGGTLPKLLESGVSIYDEKTG